MMLIELHWAVTIAAACCAAVSSPKSQGTSQNVWQGTFNPGCALVRSL